MGTWFPGIIPPEETIENEVVKEGQDDCTVTSAALISHSDPLAGAAQSLCDSYVTVLHRINTPTV